MPNSRSRGDDIIYRACPMSRSSYVFGEMQTRTTGGEGRGQLVVEYNRIETASLREDKGNKTNKELLPC